MYFLKECDGSQCTLYSNYKLSLVGCVKFLRLESQAPPPPPPLAEDVACHQPSLPVFRGVQS
jgi:hypothetical protein